MSSRRPLSLLLLSRSFSSNLNQMTRVMIVIITSNMLFMFYALNVLFSSQKYGKTFTCASFWWIKSGFFGWGAAFFYSVCKKSTRRVENSARRVDFPASQGRCRGHVKRAAFSGFLCRGGEVVVMRAVIMQAWRERVGRWDRGYFVDGKLCSFCLHFDAKTAVLRAKIYSACRNFCGACRKSCEHCRFFCNGCVLLVFRWRFAVVCKSDFVEGWWNSVIPYLYYIGLCLLFFCDREMTEVAWVKKFFSGACIIIYAQNFDESAGLG